MQNLHFIPTPRRINLAEEHCQFKQITHIVLSDRSLYEMGIFAQTRFKQANWESPEICLKPRNNADDSLHLLLNSQLGHTQGYHLRLLKKRIEIEATTITGLRYGIITLGQILRQSEQLPCGQIIDWPDLEQRGVMIDISRDKVPSLETLCQTIDLLSELKYNQLQLYTEHTFAYQNHQVVWEKASAYTGEDILFLDQYCADRAIELVPNQNSFGHMARWLNHPDYNPLSETEDKGFIHPLTGEHKPEAFSLCPSEPGSLHLMQELYDELLPHFRSSQFNIGCDETFDLGQGKSIEDCEQKGKGRVYLEFLKALHYEVHKRGKLMQFWGDIILNYPELIPELPRPCVALNWGYEADHDFAKETQALANADIPFYVCPGTSAWNSIGGRTNNMKQNIAAAVKAGLEQGAQGLLMTDWGDNGHWQPWPVSWPGFAYAAALSWHYESNQDLALHSAIDLHLFQDQAGLLGKILLELGRAHEEIELYIHNQSILFYFLHQFSEQPGTGKTEGLNLDKLITARNVLERIRELIPQCRIKRSDGYIIIEEIRLAVNLMLHGIRLTQIRLQHQLDIPELPREMKTSLKKELLDLIQIYRQYWLKRNRPGGLEDSIQGLEKLVQAYAH